MKQLINKPCRALMAIIAASLAFVAVLGSCSGYDDTELKNSVAELGDRLTALESLRDGIQADIDGLQALVENLESGSTITKVDSTADGFTIYFANPADTVKVSNGAKGDKGDKGDKGEAGQPGIAGEDAPSVIVKYDETDQKYYWGLKNSDGTEDFIKVSGNKVPVASGNLTVELNDNDEWVIKVDGQQIGDPIPSVSSNVYIQGVTIDKEAGTVTLKINDEVSLTYDLTVELSLIFGTEEEPVSVLFFEYGVPQEVSYVLAAPEEATMTITKPEGWKVTNNTADSKLTIIPPTEEVKDYAELEGNISILLTNPADGSSAISSLGVVIGEEPEITVTVGGEPVDAGTVQTFYAGATRDFNYSINYEVTELTFTYPEGWSVSAEEGVITVVSPVDAASGAASGVITATATDGEWTLTVDILSVEAKFPVEPTTAPEVGDYVYEDGTWGKETTSAIGARAIAVVFYNSNPQEFGDAELVKDHPEATHGLAVAINSAAQETRWTNINTFSWILDNITITNTLIAGDGLSADQNPLLGYSNNKVMRLFNEANPEKTQFNAVTLADEYNVSYPAPARTSGWYVPSVSEFIRLCDNTLTDITVILKSDDEEPVVVPYPTAEAVNGKLSALDGAEALSGRYFLSNRQNTSNGYIIVLDDEDGVSSVRGTSSSVADMRFILAF